MTAANRQTYLVEHYQAGAQVDELTKSASRVRDAVGQLEAEGKAVGYVSSTVVPRDDYFLTILEATSESLVREACERAGVAIGRISTAIPVGPADDPVISTLG
jgi:hypothetical protein